MDSAHLHISLMQKGFERKAEPKALALNFSALRQGGASQDDFIYDI